MTFADELYDSVSHLEAPGSTDLLNFCKAIALPFEDVYYLVRENEDGAPPWSQMFSPSLTPAAFVDWLRQAAGVRPIRGESTDATRARILAGEGYKRGTKAAIIARAAVLGATLFLVQERYLDSAYHVRYLFTVAQHTDEIEAELRNMLPAGIKLTVGFWSGVVYDDMSGFSTDYDDLASDFTDYDDLEDGP